MSMGKVFWPKHAPWKAHVQDQLLRFTGEDNNKEDDAVDTCGLFARGLKFVNASRKVTKPRVFEALGSWMGA
jgi:phage terminase large subunit-like protein